jgi:hypothetical protein
VILSTIRELFLIDTESLSTTRPNCPLFWPLPVSFFLPTPNSLTPIDRFSVSTLALTASHVLADISLSNFPCYLLHTLSIPSTLSFSLYIQLVLGPQITTKTHVQVTGQSLLVLSSLPPSLAFGKSKEKVTLRTASVEC